jgi:hypothetical protein
MIGMIRKAMLFVCAGVLVASAAMAAVPSPANSSIPCGGGSPPGDAFSIWLVGKTGAGDADPHGAVTIIVRDFAGNPIAGSAVVIDLSACTDMKVCSVQPASSGVSTFCPGTGNPQINAVTNASGQAVFKVVGGALNAAGHQPGVAIKCAGVFADGVHLGDVNLAAPDQNQSSGVNPTDVSLMKGDSLDFAGFAIYRARSDLNCSNSVNPTDTSLCQGVSLGLQSITSCSTTYCN